MRWKVWWLGGAVQQRGHSGGRRDLVLRRLRRRGAPRALRRAGSGDPARHLLHAGCGDPASDYIAQQDNPALRLPICKECARHFRSVQALHDATHTSAKVLTTMRAARNGHFIGLRNPNTGKVTFLGKGQITKNPALFDDAISRGEMPVCFWGLQKGGVASAPDRVGFTCEIDVFPGNDRAELLGTLWLIGETEFGLELRGKN